MNNFIPAPLLPSLAFGHAPKADLSAAYNYAKMLDQFSISLAEYRFRHELSQTDLADLLQISQSMVSQYENGSRNISLKTLCEHCEKLHLVPQLSFGDSSNASLSQTVDENLLPESDSLSIQYA